MATEAPFADEEYLTRYRRAQILMERDGLDALVVSEKNNYWYFTGLISYQLDHIQRPQIAFYRKPVSRCCSSMAMTKLKPRRCRGSVKCAPIRTYPFLKK